MIYQMTRMILLWISLLGTSEMVYAQHEEGYIKPWQVELGVVRTWLNDYNELCNYTPIGYTLDTVGQPYKGVRLDAIWIFQAFYDSDFSNTHRDWLDRNLKSFTAYLVAEGIYVQLSATGGDAGCPDPLLDTGCVGGCELIKLSFCYGCTDFGKDDLFIGRFNVYSYTAMGLDYSSHTITALEGEYFDDSHKLILSDCSNFQYWELRDGQVYYTEGIWYVHENQIIVDSKELIEEEEELLERRMGINWVEWQGCKFDQRRSKLIGQDTKLVLLRR